MVSLLEKTKQNAWPWLEGQMAEYIACAIFLPIRDAHVRAIARTFKTSFWYCRSRDQGRNVAFIAGAALARHHYHRLHAH